VNPTDFVTVTDTDVYGQTSLLLTWSPLEFMVVMIMASTGVILLFQTVQSLLNRNAPQTATGSEPYGSVRGRSYLVD